MNDGKLPQDGYAKIAVAVITALLTAAIGQGIVVWRDNSVIASRVEDLQRAVDGNTNSLRAIAEQSHANSIHRVEHEKNARHWIDKIIENEQSIHALQNIAGARKDPFTGSEGRELEQRIRKLEQQ
jgi:hypothetical protein